MNLELFISALRARLTVFASVLLATVLAATVVSLLLPKTYRATTLLVADAKDEQSLSNALRPLMVPQERMNYMQTQIDVITSPRVARKVVQELKLAEDPERQAEFSKETGAGSIEDWLGRDLLKRLKVETSQSSIIQVSYSSRDAELSAAVANAFARAYLETVLELRVEPTRQAALWFDEQLKSLRANLENAQIKLTDYHRKQGIVSADERLDVENSRLGELSSQLVKAQDQTIDWKTRVQEGRAALKRGSASLDKLPDIVNNPHIQKLNSELLLGEAKLQQMAAEYGANYPAYQRQQSENRALRERLDTEMRKIVAGMENAMRQSAQREAELKAAIATQRAHLLEDKVNRNELSLLTRNVETAQRTYETALQRAVVSQVDSRASQANVTVLNPAVAPGEPYRPRIALNIALSIAVGGMLGIALVILSELLDRRVRLSTDLDHGLEAPLLVVLGAGQASAIPWLAGPATTGRGALPGPA